MVTVPPSYVPVFSSTSISTSLSLTLVSIMRYSAATSTLSVVTGIWFGTSSGRLSNVPFQSFSLSSTRVLPTVSTQV